MSSLNWITSEEIDAWSERDPRRAQELLPMLVAKLILASDADIEKIHSSFGKSIQYAGYDGRLRTTKGSVNIPQGYSVWEFSTEKKSLNKFNKDFKKRTEKPLSINKSETTYVFVTSRIWNHEIEAAETAKNALNGSGWKDVLILDASDINLWLDNAPAVVAWFQCIVGKPHGAFLSLENFWTEMTTTTEPKLKKEFFMQGRELCKQEIIKWLDDGIPSHKTMVADSVLEGLLVFASALLTPTGPKADSQGTIVEYYNADSSEDINTMRILSNCIVVRDEDSWSRLLPFVTPNLIMIADFTPSSKIIYPYNCKSLLPVAKFSALERLNNKGLVIAVPQQSREDFSAGLRECCDDHEICYGLELKSRRSFLPLYRSITQNESRKVPGWTNNPNLDNLLPAVLAGSWNGNCEGDRGIIESLSETEYDKFSDSIVPWINITDAPIKKIADKYMLVSPAETYDLIYGRITKTLFKKFCQCIEEVLTTIDPAYELTKDKWFCASIYGKECKYSERIIEGLLVSLIILSSYEEDDSVFCDEPVKTCIDRLVSRILHKITSKEHCFTIAPHLQMLTEASPEAVLSKLENISQSDDQDFWAMFDPPEDIMTGRTFYTDLLYAVEPLSWDPEFAVRAVHLLCLWSEKRFEYRMVNSPINSLMEILCFWHPQTCMKTSQRLDILRMIFDRYPNTAWELAHRLFPDEFSVVGQIIKPRWKCKGIITASEPTHEEINMSAFMLADLCMEHIKADYEQWKVVFSHITYFENRIDDIGTLLIKHKEAMDQEEIAKITDFIGETIYKNRMYYDALWKIDDQLIDKLEKIYNSIKPEGLSSFHYLFKSCPYDLHPARYDEEESYEEEISKVYRRRESALLTISREFGIDGIYEIAAVSEDYYDIAHIIAEHILLFALDFIIIFKIRDLNKSIAESIILSIFNKRGIEFFNFPYSDLNDEQNAFILRSLPVSDDTLRIVETMSEEIQREYWGNLYCNFIDIPEERTDYIINKMLQYNRPCSLIYDLAYTKYCNTEMIMKILHKGLEMYPERERSGLSLAKIPSYKLEKLFEKLYADSSLEEETAKLEMYYLKCFSYKTKLKALSSQLIRNPGFFVELIMIGFPDDRNEYRGEYGSETRTKARDVLKRFKSIPGHDPESDIIDETVFNNWVTHAEYQAEQNGYTQSLSYLLGKLFAHSPAGDNGIWPCPCVCKYIESHSSQTLKQGLHDGVFNKRGVYLSTGGRNEKHLSDQYLFYADKLISWYPKTAIILKDISKMWWGESKRESDHERLSF